MNPAARLSNAIANPLYSPSMTPNCIGLRCRCSTTYAGSRLLTISEEMSVSRLVSPRLSTTGLMTMGAGAPDAARPILSFSTHSGGYIPARKPHGGGAEYEKPPRHACDACRGH